VIEKAPLPIAGAHGNGIRCPPGRGREKRIPSPSTEPMARGREERKPVLRMGQRSQGLCFELGQ